MTVNPETVSLITVSKNRRFEYFYAHFSSESRCILRASSCSLRARIGSSTYPARVISSSPVGRVWADGTDVVGVDGARSAAGVGAAGAGNGRGRGRRTTNLGGPKIASLSAGEGEGDVGR